MKPLASHAKPRKKKLRSHIVNWHASTIPISIRITNKPKIASRKSRKLTKYSAIRISDRNTTRSEQTGRAVPISLPRRTGRETSISAKSSEEDEAARAEDSAVREVHSATFSNPCLVESPEAARV